MLRLRAGGNREIAAGPFFFALSGGVIHGLANNCVGSDVILASGEETPPVVSTIFREMIVFNNNVLK